MERTRIVHYIRSRTPVVISPTSPTQPRLSSSSSLSSLASYVDDKAPLASLDPDRPVTPRRLSKSSDRSSTRSSSTGRLGSDPKPGSFVHAPAQCQEQRWSPKSPSARNGPNERTRQERPVSAFPGIGSSPKLDGYECHTLGSWSRSGRKSQAESPNASLLRRSSATLPRKISKTDVPSSDTLVKSRKRYTWLSPKQTVSHGSTATLSRRELHDGNEDDRSIITCGSSQVFDDPGSVPPSPSPSKVSSVSKRSSARYSPRLGVISGNITKESPTFSQGNVNSGISIGARSVSDDAQTIPLTPPVGPADTSGHSRPEPVHPSLPADVSGTPIIDSTGQSDIYDWKKDPRRRPCLLEDTFDLSPPQTPSESDIGRKGPPSASDIGRTGPPSDQFAKGSVNSDTGYSSSSTSETNKYATIHSPNTTVCTDMHPDSSNSQDWYYDKCNLLSHSPTLSTRTGKDYARHAYNEPQYFKYNDSTPVNETDGAPFRQCLSSSLEDQGHFISPSAISSHSSNKNPGSNPVGVRSMDRSHHGQTRDAFGLRGQSTPYTASTMSDNGLDSSSNLSKSSTTPKTAHNSSNDITVENVSMLSPRHRNSFRMAMGNCENWSDLTPTTEKPVANGSKKNQMMSPIHESSLPSLYTTERDDKYSQEDDIFVSSNDLLSPSRVNGSKSYDSNRMIQTPRNGNRNSTDTPTGNTVDTLKLIGSDPGNDDSLTRRIKRNSMRLATSSVSDLICAIDDIDIGEEAAPSSDLNQRKSSTKEKPCPTASPLPAQKKTSPSLSRTSSLLSSQNGSSFGSFYSCQSMGGVSTTNSPASNVSHRNELRARLDSPSVNRLSRNSSMNSCDKQLAHDAGYPKVNGSRSSSPVSTTSSSRSGHRQRPVYYWTRQSPYPRLLAKTSGSVASCKTSADYRAASPQPSTNSAVYPNPSNSHIRYNAPRRGSGHSENLKSMLKFSNDRGQDPRFVLHKDTQPHSRDPLPSPSSRPTSLPISSSLNSATPYTDHRFDFSTGYVSDLSPTSLIESPGSDTVRSPPSLGRPRRKQYAGFDSQPLPMDSYMSDSSSVYTGVSCSSRGTDMIGQPDNGQLDESFMSEDNRSNYTEDSRGDISFELSEAVKPVTNNVADDSREIEENECVHGSFHSSSTTKQGRVDSSSDEKDRDDSCSLNDNSLDDLIENSHDYLSSKLGKQFSPEYDAIFRLYKSDDVLGQNNLFTPGSHPLWSHNGKALSSSCLFRTKLYSKRKFMSTRDIFDLMRNSDKAPLDGTVSLTSLEQQAHRVCEAILSCDKIDQGFLNSETHSLV